MSDECPFCRVESLENIYYQKDGLVLLKNKFSTLENTIQLVLIESSKHNADIPSYDISEWSKILKLAVNFWKKLMNLSEFKSVVLYRNHGYLSGGTQSHPHMQIVGFRDINVFSEINYEYFEGLLVTHEKGTELNISTKPIMGLLELNIRWKNGQQLPKVAELIKASVDYILKDYYNGLCKDYNLFFYKLNDNYFCKIVPRFVTSQYYVGYQLSQCLDIDSLKKAKNKIKENYL